MSDNREVNQPGFFFADSEQIGWRASSMAAGVEVKDLGTTDGRFMQLVRFPPGTVFPVHEHAGPEFVYVLEGELIQNGKRLGRGWVSVSSAGTDRKSVV